MADATIEAGERPDLRDRGRLCIAAVQATPVLFDRAATLTVAAAEIAKAAIAGADLVAFPESFVPGYPDWVWRRPPMSDGAWYARFSDQAVNVDGSDLDPVRDAGRERVRVGSLICWENYMPLARAAMYQSGIDVLLAPTWDNSDEWVPTLRHIAKEGQIFVVGITAYVRGSDVPRDLPDADELYGGDDDWMSIGNTTIVAPGGQILAGPLTGSSGTLVETLDMDRIVAGRRMFDPTGHYARPDVLSLRVTRGALHD